METTRLSSKGQVIIPQGIRDAHHWEPGLNFAVTEIDGSILLTPVSPFKSVSVEELRGCVGYKGSPKTLGDMEEAIKKGATGKT